MAKVARRAEWENGNLGSMPPLSEADIAEAEAFLTEMLLIYPVLGIQVFNKPDEQPSSSVRLYLVGKGAKAEGTETADGFVVHAGSLARLDEVPSIHAYGMEIRTVMKEKGLLVEDSGFLRFTDDHLFGSPSTAAMVVLGRTANGRVAWKTADGQTLKDLQTDLTGEIGLGGG